MNNKKGVSAVIALMMLILFALLIAGIIWNVLNKTIDEELSEAKSCYDLLGKIVFNSEYICYDSSGEKMHISVEVGDIEIDGLFMVLSHEYSSDIFELTNNWEIIENLRNYNGTSETKVPNKNSGLTYIASNVAEMPLSIGLTPVLNGNRCAGDIFTNIERCSPGDESPPEEPLAWYYTDSSLVGYWSMDNLDASAVYDDSYLGGNDCTYNGGLGPEDAVTGRVGNALEFTGEDNGPWLNCGTDESINMTSDFTVLAWVNPYSIPNTDPPLAEGRMVVNAYDYEGVGTDIHSGWYLGAVWTYNEFDFQVHDGEGGEGSAENYDIFNDNLNNWVHVAGVFSPGNYARLYVNGAESGYDDSDVPTEVQVTGDSVTIGRRSAEAQSYWHGLIDEVMIFDKELTEAQIISIYQEGA